jgi:hypothetical protein
MANERLSKLQKWILSESYKLNILHDGSVVGGERNCYYRLGMKGYANADKNLTYQYFECWIYEKYYGFRNRHGSGISGTPAYKKAHVTVCRAVQSMERKGLIYVNYYFSYEMKNWRISTKGIDTLKRLCGVL